MSSPEPEVGSTPGLDTSVVLRLLVGEPAHQAERAMEFVQACARAGRRCFVSDLVVCEAYFALCSHYQVPKGEALRALLNLLESPLVSASTQVLQALRSAMTSSSKPGFVDRLIHLVYQPNPLVTFEKAASKLQGSLVLPV